MNLGREFGLSKKTINDFFEDGIEDPNILNFCHSDINQMYTQLPKPSQYQSWDTSGKRYVHLEEVQFVVRHLVRNGTPLKNRRALILSGSDPALACLPWAMSGLVSEFDAYEKAIDPYFIARGKLEKELQKIIDCSSGNKKIELNLIYKNCFKVKNKEYGIIDLDFCNNQLKDYTQRNLLFDLINRIAPKTGPFVFRTTLHIGRTNNSKEEVEENIEAFERRLKIGNSPSNRFIVKAFERSPYQSTLPMIALTWILERKK